MCADTEKGIAIIDNELERVCAYTEMSIDYVIASMVQLVHTTNPPSPVPTFQSVSHSTSFPTTDDVSPLGTSSVDPSLADETVDSAPKEVSANPSADPTTMMLVPTARPSLFVVDTSNPSASPSELHSSFEDVGLSSPSVSPMGNPSVSPAVSLLSPSLQYEAWEATAPILPVIWDEQYVSDSSKTAGNHDYGQVKQSNDESSSPSPVVIVGVAAAVAIVVTAWIAGMFVVRRNGKHLIKHPRSEHEEVRYFDKKDEIGNDSEEVELLDVELGRAQVLSVQIPDSESSPELDSFSQGDSDSSGWSSSAGLSSLRTATFDSLTDDEMPCVVLKDVPTMKEIVK